MIINAISVDAEVLRLELCVWILLVVMGQVV